MKHIGIINTPMYSLRIPSRGMDCTLIGCCRSVDRFKQRCESPLYFDVIVCYNQIHFLCQKCIDNGNADRRFSGSILYIQRHMLFALTDAIPVSQPIAQCGSSPHHRHDQNQQKSNAPFITIPPSIEVKATLFKKESYLIAVQSHNTNLHSKGFAKG